MRAQIAREAPVARVPLRRLLKTLGLVAVEPEAADALLDKLRRHVASAGESRVAYLAAFAAQLARVAWIDDQFTAEEHAAVRDVLANRAGLAGSEADLVAALLAEQRQILLDVQAVHLTRALNEYGSRQDKEKLLDCLYAIASADHLVSDDEDREVRRVGRALLVPNERVMDIRSRYRDRLEVMQLASRSRGGSAEADE